MDIFDLMGGICTAEKCGGVAENILFELIFGGLQRLGLEFFRCARLVGWRRGRDDVARACALGAQGDFEDGGFIDRNFGAKKRVPTHFPFDGADLESVVGGAIWIGAAS